MMHRDMDDRENELWKENTNSSKGKRGSWPRQPGAGTGGTELSLRLVLEQWSQSCSAQHGEGLYPPPRAPPAVETVTHLVLVPSKPVFLDMSMEVLGRLEPASHGI